MSGDGIDEDLINEVAASRYSHQSHSSGLGSRRSKRKRSPINHYENSNSCSEEPRTVRSRSHSKASMDQEKSFKESDSPELGEHFRLASVSATESDERHISDMVEEVLAAANQFETLNTAIRQAAQPREQLSGGVFKDFEGKISLVIGNLIDGLNYLQVDWPDIHSVDISSLGSMLNVLARISRELQDEKVVELLSKNVGIGEWGRRAEHLRNFTNGMSKLWTQK